MTAWASWRLSGLERPISPFVCYSRQSRQELSCVRNSSGTGARRASQFLSMSAPRLPLWYRHAWWLPGAYSAFAVAFAASALNPTEGSVLLSLAILCALPWSLVLLLLDVERGLADIGAAIVFLGLYANAALLWWSTALLRARFR